MEDFGKYLYQLRTRKGKYISQRKLAELTGYIQTYIFSGNWKEYAIKKILIKQ